MPELPQKKVGIVACSGEELPGGTVTRLAALRVLEQLRPADTVTICLPLFLAGGEGDRAFARFYPTVAIDGCEKRCAARATELYSGKPAAGIVVSDIVEAKGFAEPRGLRALDEAGQQVVEETAALVAQTVDELLGRSWSRSKGEFLDSGVLLADEQEAADATCSCGSGIPTQVVDIDGTAVSLVALPLIFEQFREAEQEARDELAADLLDRVRIYNPIPDGEQQSYAEALIREYREYLLQQELPA
ncbi:MAG: hypothetical protein E4G99_00565 [Anaerolineales bacterium]|nr:MAG: hypothetical protein E4G99_00565 [Anaerolineales bacterium]